MSVVLVRHTRPVVEQGICYGRTDLELAGSFVDEATQVIAELQPFDVLVTSPLSRCRRLAEKIGVRFDKVANIDERVQEMDFGAWEGRAWSSIPSDELDVWADDFLHARPHGGESVAMLRERSLAALHEFADSGKRHAVVTHSGVIRSAFALGDTAESFNTAIDFGGIVEFNTQQDTPDDRR